MQNNVGSILIGQKVYIRWQFWVEISSFIRENQYQWIARKTGLSVIFLSCTYSMQPHYICYVLIFQCSRRLAPCLILQMRRLNLSYVINKLWNSSLVAKFMSNHKVHKLICKCKNYDMLSASYPLEVECSLFWWVSSIMMLSLFLAAEVILEHKGDALPFSIKMLTFLIIPLLSKYIEAPVLLQDSLLIGIEELFIIIIFTIVIT